MTWNPTDWYVYVAKQTARGIYPAAAEYCLSVVSGSLKNNAELGSIAVGEQGPFTAPIKRIKSQKTGGTLVVLAGPEVTGALHAWGYGADTPTGGADPYSHAIVPAAGVTDWPFLTFWQYLAGRWEQFRDCQIMRIKDTSSNDGDGFERVEIEVAGLQRKMLVAALGTPPAAETDFIHWLDGSGHYVLNGDYTNLDDGVMPTDLASLKTYLTNFKAKYNAHLAVASGLHHKAADATNTLTYATSPADLTACETALAEIKTDYAAHRVNTTVHVFADATNAINFSNPTGLDACLAAVQELRGLVNAPGTYNRHLGMIAGLKSVTTELSMDASTPQGEDATAYTVWRKKGKVTVSVEVLKEDWRQSNLAQYGDIAPVAGSEASDELQHGSFYAKWTASIAGNERSREILIPQFDYDPAGLDTEGDMSGSEKYDAIAGEASGNSPIITQTIKNAVAAY